MRIRLVKGLRLRFYRDVSTPSCGENRAEWELVGECSLERLVRALERMVTGKSEVEWV